MENWENNYGGYANHRTGKEIVLEGKVSEPLRTVVANPICLCGQESVVAVAQTEKDAGRRFFCCDAYEGHKVFPDEIECCYFKQWIDPPMCERGRQYALESQAEIKRLKKVVGDKTIAGPFPRPW